MEPIALDLFTQYKFLSGLRRGPQGGLAFLAAQADPEENTYRRDLWLAPQEGEAFWVQPFDLKSQEELDAHEAELTEEYMVNVQKSTYLLLKQRLKERQDMELESEAVLEDQSILLTINVS